ncbi:ADAM 17-like protease isoform X2 [Physella acuta]|nr:ADAM 17-like protease isoform X2 [Physella acuta]XP_059159850.1 ADAM 17-like protease isoform X2 [Physella acuta]
MGISTYVKRSADIQVFYKFVKFKIFNRNFQLTLRPDTDVLAEEFKAYIVDADDRKKSLAVDQILVFTGHCTDNPAVYVSAYMEGTLLALQIFEENDTYVIEPAVNLLKSSENPHNDTLIAYRSSDLVDSVGRCGVESSHTKSQHFSTNYVKHPSFLKKNTKVKRSLSGDTCLLYLVADFDFYSNRCRKQHLACLSLMVSLVQNVDRIYRQSKFVGGDFEVFTGIGIRISVIVLYTTPTITTNIPVTHFNSWHASWDMHSKMESFAYHMSFVNVVTPVCLGHLLTSYPMPKHILGLAKLDGICRMSFAGVNAPNVGVSSDTDIQNGPIPSLLLNIVMAHGHNFGSDHDPLTSECAPSDQNGGKYLMWDRSQSGRFVNNKFFSPCSLRSIGRTLEWIHCLKVRKTLHSFCGNGLVEPGEECDAGALGLVHLDMCCNSHCQIAAQFVCSDQNTECCLGCVLAKNGTVCYNTGDVECKQKSYCTGDSFVCPPPRDLPNWTKCIDGGQCYNGECRSLCEIKSIKENKTLKPCLCESSDENACKWCCFDYSNPDLPGACVPYAEEILKDGRPCYSGYCQDGLCKRNITSMIYRIHTYLKSIPSIGTVKFMRSNIVLIVVVVSSIVWIPISRATYYSDCRDRAVRENLYFRNKKQHKKEMAVDGLKDSLKIYPKAAQIEETCSMENSSSTFSNILSMMIPSDYSPEGSTFSARLRAPLSRSFNKKTASKTITEGSLLEDTLIL